MGFNRSKSLHTGRPSEGSSDSRQTKLDRHGKFPLSLLSSPVTPSDSADASAVSKLYGTRMHAFLNRADIKEELGEFADMLKGSHGVRKGATNHGATAGLVANVLIAVLLRGQWDIGDTLKRYFKEHQAGDALVGRVLAGLDMYDVSFAALPPHFPKATRRIDVLAMAQFANNPLGCDSAPVGSKEVLQMCLASLVHHFEKLDEVLPDDHTLRNTALFRLEDNVRSELFGQLGPELGHRSDSREYGTNKMTATGIPPHTSYMMQSLGFHKEVMAQFKEVKENQKKILENQKKILENQERTNKTIFDALTKGTAIVGADLVADKSAEVLENGKMMKCLEEMMRMMKGQHRAATSSSDSDFSACFSDSDSDSDSHAGSTPNNEATSGSSSSSSSSNNNSAATGSHSSLSLPTFPISMHTWARPAQRKYDRKKKIYVEYKKAETQKLYRRLPKTFSFSGTTGLAGIFKRFMWQSGTKKNTIPALNTIRNPAFDIAEDKVLRQFAKARTLTNLMLELTKSTEPGRALLQTFNSEPSYNSLNALATHAQKAYLDSAPARLTGKKRGRLEETHFITAEGWAPKIRRQLREDKTCVYNTISIKMCKLRDFAPFIHFTPPPSLTLPCSTSMYSAFFEVALATSFFHQCRRSDNHLL